SNLKRTFQTVVPFAKLQIPVIPHAGLDEISWGVHEGQKDGDSFRRFYEILHMWKNGDVGQHIEGGESPLEVQNRQLAFIEELRKENAEKILICSHGRAMRILLCTMLNRHLKEMDNFPHKNLSLYKLNLIADAFEIELFNETKHVAATL
ncbi:MAG: histidine phosphatase family protein, partial [Chitinophagales bacterium]